MKVRRKPAVIDATQYRGDIESILVEPEFAKLSYERRFNNELWIYSARDRRYVICPLNYWIVRDLNGDYYAVEPDKFVTSYEPVPELGEL